MFKTRLISGIFLVAAAFLTISCGGYVLLATLGCVSLIGMQELAKAMKVRKEEDRILEIIIFICAACYYLVLPLGFEQWGMAMAILTLVMIMCTYVFTYPRYHVQQVMAAYFSFIYVAVMLSFVWLTRELPQGRILVWLVFFSSWGCDTCAYCVGMLIGRHKMAPVLSPKKSIEGAVGGVAGAALLGCLYALATGSPAWEYALICAAGSLISMVGDLAASAIKRNQEIKDYGSLIPGHGGILDRFDSVIFTAPVIYYLGRILLSL